MQEIYSILNQGIGLIAIDHVLVYLHLTRLGFVLCKTNSLFLPGQNLTSSLRDDVFEICPYIGWSPAKKDKFKKRDQTQIPDFLILVSSAGCALPSSRQLSMIQEFLNAFKTSSLNNIQLIAGLVDSAASISWLSIEINDDIPDISDLLDSDWSNMD
jgi:hypothetical protein